MLLQKTALIATFGVAIVAFGGCSAKKSSETAHQFIADSMSITQEPFGKLADGTETILFTLRNAQGVTAKISNYGGIVTHLLVPDQQGTLEDVVLGYDSLAGYLKETPYFGAIVGRYGNRIAKGQFVLNGQTYKLAKNNGQNHLHGGLMGFDKVVWKAETSQTNDGSPVLTLTYTSKDMEEGYPGNLSTKVTYTLGQDNSLRIDYEATTDKATVVNLTNHSYFNLTGNTKRNVLDHEVTLNASKMVPVDASLIPTGQLLPVQNTPFDFTKSRKIGDAIDQTSDEQIKFGGGYDHCWVLNKPTTNDSLTYVAKVIEPASGRVMEVMTTEPGVQFYTGNFLDGSIVGKKGVAYQKRFGFCLETEHYPDSPNQPQFPSVVLQPGQTYTTTTIYKFSTLK